MFNALTSLCKFVVRLTAIAILLGAGLPLVLFCSLAFGAIFTSIALLFGAIVGFMIVVLACWWLAMRGDLADVIAKAIKEAKAKS